MITQLLYMEVVLLPLFSILNSCLRTRGLKGSHKLVKILIGFYSFNYSELMEKKFNEKKVFF